MTNLNPSLAFSRREFPRSKPVNAALSSMMLCTAIFSIWVGRAARLGGKHLVRAFVGDVNFFPLQQCAGIL
jgi:hypothetical protein